MPSSKGRKGPPMARAEAEPSFIDKSFEFMKDLSIRIKNEATRTLKTTNLNIEVGMKKRNLRRKYAEIGEAAFRLWKEKTLKVEPLADLFKQAEGMEHEIAMTGGRIKQLLATDEELRRHAGETAGEHEEPLAAQAGEEEDGLDDDDRAARPAGSRKGAGARRGGRRAGGARGPRPVARADSNLETGRPSGGGGAGDGEDDPS